MVNMQKTMDCSLYDLVKPREKLPYHNQLSIRTPMDYEQWFDEDKAIESERYLDAFVGKEVYFFAKILNCLGRSKDDSYKMYDIAIYTNRQVSNGYFQIVNTVPVDLFLFGTVKVPTLLTDLIVGSNVFVKAYCNNVSDVPVACECRMQKYALENMTKFLPCTKFFDLYAKTLIPVDVKNRLEGSMLLTYFKRDFADSLITIPVERKTQQNNIEVITDKVRYVNGRIYLYFTVYNNLKHVLSLDKLYIGVNTVKPISPWDRQNYVSAQHIDANGKAKMLEYSVKGVDISPLQSVDVKGNTTETLCLSVPCTAFPHFKAFLTVRMDNPYLRDVFDFVPFRLV